MELKLERKRGDTYPLILEFEVDITGFAIRFVVTSMPEPSAVDVVYLLDKTATQASAKTAKVLFTPEDVDLVGRYYYEVTVTDLTGYIHTTNWGDITFKQDRAK